MAGQPNQASGRNYQRETRESVLAAYYRLEFRACGCPVQANMAMADYAKRLDARDTGVRKHDVELALLLLDLVEETIEVGEVRYVSLDAGDISSDFLHRRG